MNEKLKYLSLIHILCALCVTLTVGINLLVNELPVESTKLDTTEIGLHTLSDNTKELLNSITEDIYIYLSLIHI